MRNAAFFARRDRVAQWLTNPEDDVLRGREQDDAAPQNNGQYSYNRVFHNNCETALSVTMPDNRKRHKRLRCQLTTGVSKN
jgi:hypothetical protein